MLGINILKTYYKKNIIKKYIINYKIIAHQLNADYVFLSYLGNVCCAIEVVIKKWLKSIIV